MFHDGWWEHCYGDGIYIFGRLIFGDKKDYDNAKQLIIKKKLVDSEGRWIGVRPEFKLIDDDSEYKKFESEKAFHDEKRMIFISLCRYTDLPKLLPQICAGAIKTEINTCRPREVTFQLESWAKEGRIDSPPDADSYDSEDGDQFESDYMAWAEAWAPNVALPTNEVLLELAIELGIKNKAFSETSKYFEIKKIGSETILNKFLMKGEPDIVIPNDITIIGQGAFSDLEELKGLGITSVLIPEGVKKIHDGAFYGNQLTNLQLPNSISEIGRAAFYQNKLRTLILPDGITYIHSAAFSRNKLLEIAIPAGLNSISEELFSENQLVLVQIPNTIKEIGSGAFSENHIEKIVIPSSVTKISDEAFYCNQLKSITLNMGLSIIGDGAFYGNHLTEVTLPDTVTMIGRDAFRDNKLTQVEIPSSVTHLSSEAFDPNVKIIRKDPIK